MNCFKLKFFLYLLLALLYSPIYSRAQSNSGNARSYDTTYHNYLYDQRTAYFRSLPDTPDEIIFLGNSITHWGDWAELLGNAKVRNRGIAGDISFGVLNRLDEVVSSKPSKIFLMIGVNDIGRNIPQKLTIEIYEKIIKVIRSKSPETMIYIQSVLPINNKLINRKYYTGTNEEIKLLNEELKILAKRSKLPYIDLYASLADASGELPEKYTYDGIHLSAEAYIHWTSLLKNEGYCCSKVNK